MKKIILVSLAAICMSLPACKTAPSPALTKAFIRTATSTAVSLGIAKDTNTIPYLRAAAPIICSASTGVNFSPHEVVAALESSNAKALKTPSAVIIINSVIGFYSAAYEQYGGTNIAIAKPYLEGICEGLNDALPARGIMKAAKSQPHVE